MTPLPTHVMWPVPFRMRCPYCRFPSLARFAQWSAATALRSLTTAALCLATIAARSAFARTHFRACPLINRRLRIGRSRILVSTTWRTAAHVDEEAPMSKLVANGALECQLAHAGTVHGDALDVDLAGGAHLELVPAASTGENSHAQQLVQIATLFAARLATTTAAARTGSLPNTGATTLPPLSHAREE